MPKPGQFTSQDTERRQKASKSGIRATLKQIAAIQAQLYADCMDAEVPAGYRAQAARAWDVLEERKRILRMKPKPRDLDMSDHIAKRKQNRLPAPLILESPPSDSQQSVG